MDEISAQLKSYWTTNGIRGKPGTSEESLSYFESAYHITLPTSIRNYLLTVNGMERNVTDPQLIRFWSLEEMRPHVCNIDTEYTIVEFADYSILSHTYAFRLMKAPTPDTPVYVMGDRQPRLIAPGFAEFVELYLAGKVLDFLKTSGLP